MAKEKAFCWGPNCKEEIEVEICCNAFDCGCRGLPVEPPFCGEACYDAYILRREILKDEPLKPLDFD